MLQGSLDADTHAHEVRLSQQAALIENPSADLDQTSEQAGNLSGYVLTVTVRTVRLGTCNV